MTTKWSKKSNKIFSDIKKYGPNINRKIYNSSRVNYTNEDTLNNFKNRRYFTKHYAWAIPNKTAIIKIKKFAKKEKILEVGAGLGLWAYLLQEANANIVATDDFSWKDKKLKDFTKVEKLNVQDSLEKYKDCNILLLVWPPYDKPMANNALKKFKGNKLVYIGEEEGGATANDNFYIRLKKKWKQVDKYDIPGWISIHDTMTFYERK
jgi:hypothetical protein